MPDAFATSELDEGRGSPLPPVWVISLESAVERRARIVERLERIGLPFDLCRAVDGNSLGEAEFSKHYDPYLATARTGGQLSVGQIAAALSHQELYRRMIHERVPEVLIMEDDAVPTRGLLSVLRNRTRFPRDWEVMLLYHGQARHSLWRRKRLVDEYRAVPIATYVDGAVGYMIRESAARKLLAVGVPVHLPADYLLGGWVTSGVRRYGVVPNCILHDDGPSTRPAAMPEGDGDFRAAKREFACRYPPRSKLSNRWRNFLRVIDPRDPFRNP